MTLNIFELLLLQDLRILNRHPNHSYGIIHSVRKFEFGNYSSTLNANDLKIKCTQNHVHQVSIITAYDVDLYKAWTIELHDSYSAIHNVHVSNVDIGYNFLHLQRSIFRQISTHLMRLNAIQYIFKINRFQIKYKKLRNSRNFWKLVSKAMKSTVTIFRLNALMLRNDHCNEFQKQKSIFSTLATTFGTVEFGIRKNIFKIFILNIAFEFSYNRTQEVINKLEPCSLLVGNGRLVRAAAVVAASRNNSIETIIIERGAFPGTFDLYRISPHSIQERRSQVQRLVRKFSDKEREKIASEYIQLRQEYDPISGIRWQRKFETGKLPPLDSRKICVCFTSTETEFAVFGDELPTDHFQSQEEAFKALASALNPTEWQIIIRRHPYGNKRIKTDPEKKLWSELSNFTHVSFVGPNEPIDSYELSRVADLVAHFNSSMGPEAISLVSAPVITMGPTIWENEQSLYYVCSYERLQKFLASSPKAREMSEIFNWGLYWATFGYKFKKVHWKSNKGYVNDKRIL